MSEVIISKRGIYGNSGSGTGELMTMKFGAGNHTFTIPSSIKSNNISVLLIAGGCSYEEGGDGGGINNKTIQVKPGEVINIMVGKGGYNRKTTAEGSFFGTYLSANTHEGGGGWQGLYNSPFGASNGMSSILYGGGGGDCWYRNGGNGGTYGGGGGGMARFYIRSNQDQYDINWNSLDLHTYVQTYPILADTRAWNGGNGGTYGGGGCGGMACIGAWSTMFNSVYGNCGKGGQYGGNGGNQTPSKNGTNTIGWDNVPEELQGPGLAGNNKIMQLQLYNSTRVYANMYGGGGGFGGCGGNIKIAYALDDSTTLVDSRVGSFIILSRIWRNSNIINHFELEYGNYKNFGFILYGGAGGGGYGSYGGNGNYWFQNNGPHYNASSIDYSIYGAGGGGYGGNGNYMGGGGGYFSDAIGRAGGGYYNWCCGGDQLYNESRNSNDYGCGGFLWINKALGTSQNNGADGVCIIQYYI